MGKVLYLREMGMNYNNPAKDGINNHRVRVLENIDIIYQGESYNLFFEFMQWAHYAYRTINKRTGAELKHPVKELINANCLYLDTEYEKAAADGFTFSYRLRAFEREICDANYDYTKKSILDIVNKYSVKKYDKVILIEEEARNIVDRIGGYREKSILADTWTYMSLTDTWNDDRRVVRFTERVKTPCGPGAWRHLDGNSFDVDIVTKTIVG